MVQSSKIAAALRAFALYFLFGVAFGVGVVLAFKAFLEI